MSNRSPRSPATANGKDDQPRQVTGSKSIVGKLLGDSLVGSCWRAVEQAAEPDVEVRFYVRSIAEADVALTIVMSQASRRGLIDLRAGADIDMERAGRLADELGAVVAIELTNGSVIAFRKETRAP